MPPPPSPVDGTGSTTTATYAYGNALIRKDGDVPLFDGLGSERTVTNSNQSVTGTRTTEGFGQTVATTGSSTNPYMFAVGAVTGGLIATPVLGGLKTIISPPPPVIDPITRTIGWRLFDSSALK